MGKRTKKPRNKRLGPQNPVAREAARRADATPFSWPRPLIDYEDLLPEEEDDGIPLHVQEEIRAEVEAEQAEAMAQRDELLGRLSYRLEVSRHPLFRYGRADEGLGPHAELVFWAAPASAEKGRTFDEMVKATLYKPPTVLKYLHGMQEVGLLEERDGRWSRTDIDLDEAERRAQERLNAGSGS